MTAQLLALPQTGTEPEPLETSNLDDARWQAVLARDTRADGTFYCGVLTTGIFCRPSCPSRRPNRANVRFYETPDDARAAGLRPCLRCHPLAPADETTAAIRRLCQYIEAHADRTMTLGDLSRRARMSPSHLQRRFKAVVGVSPKQYLDGCRMKALKSALRDGTQDSVTGAIFEAGYGSLSRVYGRAGTRLGMTPMEYRAHGRGVHITYAVARTPLGLLMMGATDRGVCFVQFGDRTPALASALRAEYPEATIAPLNDPPPPEFQSWMTALNAYLSGEVVDLRLPVHVRATAFQLKVWTYLQSIPPGRVESYQEVATALGLPRGARAVARACASNEVALVIPCHRVIRGSGELAGYRWGLPRKRTLLDLERRAVRGNDV
jgi:AraC family transcriptional regulator of adaptative response/methylated-DNA-[protein]-cysteine methyltransferase